MTPILKLFENAYGIYKSKFKILTKLALFNVLACLIVVPFGIAFAIATGFALFSYKTNFTASAIVFLIGVLILLVGILIAVILGLVALVSTFWAVKEGNNQTTVKEMFAKAWPKAGSFFWVSFLAGLAALGGFILFVIPGIIISVWFSQSLFVFVFEDLNGTQALKRSKALVQGNWGKVFLRFLAIAVIGMLISSMKVVGPIVNMLFLTPFSAVYCYLIYQDLKTAKA